MPIIYVQQKSNSSTTTPLTNQQIRRIGQHSMRRLAGHPQPPGGS